MIIKIIMTRNKIIMTRKKMIIILTIMFIPLLNALVKEEGTSFKTTKSAENSDDT